MVRKGHLGVLASDADWFLDGSGELNWVQAGRAFSNAGSVFSMLIDGLSLGLLVGAQPGPSLAGLN